MRYFYKEKEDIRRFHGIIYIHRCRNFLFTEGTLYYKKGYGLIVVRKYFDENKKKCWYGPLSQGLANDIFLNKNFERIFYELAGKRGADGYPFIDVRKLMWQLRMKPLKKDIWEFFF